MTTIYRFRAYFTKAGVGSAPSDTPTLTAVDMSNNILVNEQNATKISNLPGLVIYDYSGSDGLELIGRFHTTDTTLDQPYDLPSYPLPAMGYVPQTGDAYARIGAAGAGLTALGDARLANILDATGIRAAIGLALANLDTQLNTINAKTANLPGDPASQSEIQAAIDAIDPATLETILNKLDTMLVENGLAWAFTTAAFSNFSVDNVDLGDEAISSIAYSIGVQLLQMATSRYVMSLQNPPTKSVDVNKYATWSMSAAYGDSAFDVAFLTMKSTLSLGDDAAELQVSYTAAGNIVVTKVAGVVVPDGATVVDDTINKRLLVTVNTVALGLLTTKTYKTDVKIVGDPESVVLASLEVVLKDGVTRSTGV